MFESSLNSGGTFATSVISAVAKGNMSSVGSITGEQASEALTSYLGYSAMVANEVNADDGVSVPPSPGRSEDTITLDGGTAAGAIPPEPSPTYAGGDSIPDPGPGGAIPFTVGSTTEVSAGSPSLGSAPHSMAPNGSAIPSSPPTFRDVEIGGGRITGHEVSPDGQSEREFAMYCTEQYMAPTGPYDTVQTVDGSSWYRQYAQPTVIKTPYKDGDEKIKYQERIVQQMPPVPKRKDKV